MRGVEFRGHRAPRRRSAGAGHRATHRPDRRREDCPDGGSARADASCDSLVRRGVLRLLGRRCPRDGVAVSGRAINSEQKTGTPMSARPFDEYRGTPLWSAIEATIAELVATQELSVNTAPAYVVGYLCRELAAKRLVASQALDK